MRGGSRRGRALRANTPRPGSLVCHLPDLGALPHFRSAFAYCGTYRGLLEPPPLPLPLPIRPALVSLLPEATLDWLHYSRHVITVAVRAISG